MSETLPKVIALVQQGELLISAHGYDELAADNILVQEAVNGIAQALLVEDYPTYHKGPAVLVLQEDNHGDPIHVVWGTPALPGSPPTAQILDSGQVTGPGENDD